jgi:predicted transcriptional regulator of viral defense system
MKYLDLKNELENYKLNLFSLNEVIKITKQKKEVIKSVISRLINQNKIYKIKKGFYSINKIENKFILNKVFNNTYIGLNSALEYYETTTQRYNNLDLISKNVLNDQKINSFKINFHKINEKLFFGYERKEINNQDVFISNIEKTIIDCVYFSSKIYLSEINLFVKKMKTKIDLEILKTYLEKINSSSLNKRIGYLLEINGLFINNLKINNKYEKLNKNLKETNNKHKKWKLIINEEL